MAQNSMNVLFCDAMVAGRRAALRRAIVAAFIAATTGLGSAPPQALGADATFTLGEVLRLSTRHELTRGVLQRPTLFLDVANSKRRLQVAIVLDGTESMDREIDSVKKHLQQFASSILDQKDDDATIEFAVLIFRDTGAAAGVIERVVPDFTTNIDEVIAKLQSVRTQTGKPFFNEPADVAIETALTELSWAPRTEDADCTRWLLICTDAPPFARRKLEPRRQFDVPALVDEAQQRAVEVYAVLCNSGFAEGNANNAKLEAVARQLRPAAVDFFGAICQQTNGKFLDMWNQEHLEMLIGVAREKQRVVQVMRRITADEIAEFRRARGQDGGVSIAFLPHLPGAEMTFAPNHPEVLAAIELQERFGRLPGLEIVRTGALETAWRKVSPTASETDAVRQIADSVGADYVVWGARGDRPGAVESSLFDGQSGRVIATSMGTVMDAAGEMYGSAADLAESLRRRILDGLRDSDDDNAAAAALAAADEDAGVAESFGRSIATDIRAQRAILQGLAMLERALQFELGNDEAMPALEAAEEFLQTAVEMEPDSAFAHLLLANCYYNMGRLDAVDDYLTKQYKHLSRAAKYARDQLSADDPIRLEIEADYQLLVAKDAAKAAELLNQIVEQGSAYSRGSFALRAHWMLAGIYLGDWDVAEFAPEIVDVEAARRHVLHIVGAWPESSEAVFYLDLMQRQPDDMLALELGGTPLVAR